MQTFSQLQLLQFLLASATCAVFSYYNKLLYSLIAFMSLNEYLQELYWSVFIVCAFIASNTNLNNIKRWDRKSHTEPWRRFSIAIAFPFTLLSIPDWIVSVNNFLRTPSPWISRLTEIVITNKAWRGHCVHSWISMWTVGSACNWQQSLLMHQLYMSRCDCEAFHVSH